MPGFEPTSAAERMKTLRDGGRRGAAHVVATATTDFEYGREALPGLEEDLFSSRLSLSDLEELAAILLDHARQPVPQRMQEENVASTENRPLLRRISARQGSLWKFNVNPTNLAICIEHDLFADNKQHKLVEGDLLLLQQIKSKNVDRHRRITHVFGFDHYARDVAGRSQELWGNHYQYLLHGRIQALSRPFSLEDLSLSKSYSQQGKISPERIADADEQAVLDAIGPL